jgi:hypothetical protein
VFEVNHFPKTSEEPPHANSNLPSSATSFLKSSSRVDIEPKYVNEESGVDVQYATTKAVQEMLSPMQAKRHHSETNPNGGSSNPSSPSSLEGSPNPELMQRSQPLEEKLDDNITSKPEIYQVNDFEDTVEESKKEIPKNSTVAPAQSDSEPITSGRVEVLTRLEHFLKSDEVNSKEEDLFKRLENALQKREAQSGHGPTKSKSKPIKFKDAVGRKFSFPFDLCKTWGGRFDHRFSTRPFS